MNLDKVLKQILEEVIRQAENAVIREYTGIYF